MKVTTTYMVSALLLAALIGGVALGASKDATKFGVAQEATVSQSLMRQKLERSQRLLEALALADFPRIAINAEELQRISVEAQWIQPHSPEYAEFGDDFRHSLGRVVQAANNHNIDGAALNFVQVILTCVQCHNVVREGQALASISDSSIPALVERRTIVSAQVLDGSTAR